MRVFLELKCNNFIAHHTCVLRSIKSGRIIFVPETIKIELNAKPIGPILLFSSQLLQGFTRSHIANLLHPHSACSHAHRTRSHIVCTRTFGYLHFGNRFHYFLILDHFISPVVPFPLSPLLSGAENHTEFFFRPSVRECLSSS